MNELDFLNAIKTIAPYHTTKLYINKPYTNSIGQLGSKEFTIRIEECCGAVMTDLLEQGYSLSMKDGLTTVNKY